MRALLTSLFVCLSYLFAYSQSTSIAWADIAHGNLGGTYATALSGSNFFAAEVISQTGSRTIRIKRYNGTPTFRTTEIYSDDCQACSTSGDIPLRLLPASDGGAFLYYEVANNSPVIKKISPTGNVLWTQNFNNLKFIKASPTKANGIYLLFQVTSGSNANKYFIYNLDLSGFTNWTRDLGSNLLNDMAVTFDNGLIITDADSTKRLDSQGNRLWGVNRGGAIVKVVDSDFGYQADANRVIRFSLSTGNIDFVRNQQGINDLLVTSDKSVVFSTNDKVQKLSTSGNNVWTNSNGSQRLTLAANGSIGSIGTTNSNTITVYNPDGSVRWLKTLTYNLGEKVTIHPAPDGGWYSTTSGQVPGKASSFGTGFLYRIDPINAGCNYTVNISPNTKQIACKTVNSTFEVTQLGLDLSYGFPSTDYSVQWLREGQIIASNSRTYLGSQAGEYTVQIVQGNCVKSSAKVEVEVVGNTAPVITSDITELCVNGGANVTLTSTGCTNNANTRWSNNITGVSNVVSPNTTTSYTAQCVDTYTENGVARECISPTSTAQRISVLSVSDLSITEEIRSSDAICSGTSEALNVTVNGSFSAPLTYLWTRDGTSVGSLPTYNASTAGNYQVSVKDKRGCSALSTTKELQLVGTKVPTLTSSLSEICLGSSFSSIISASGCDAGVLWNTQANTPTITVSPTTTTQYSARCIDTFSSASGNTKTCFGANSSAQTLVVRQQSNITITDLFAPDVFCKNDFQDTIRTEVKNFVGELVFNWYRNNELISNALEIIVSDAGDYQLKVEDVRGCTAESLVKNIAQSELTLSVTGNQSFCEGSSTSFQGSALNGIGIPTYEWRLGDQLLSTTNQLTVSTPGNYTVRATDSKGCEEIIPLPISFYPKITADYSKVATVKGNLLYSFDEEKLLGGTKPFALELSALSESGDSIPINQNTIGTFKENGTIFVKVKDANECELLDSISINYVPCDVAVNISGDTSFCFYDKIELRANQLTGIEPFTYSWTVADATIQNENTSIINTGIQGIYRATMTDSAQCTVTSEAFALRERGRDIVAFIRSNSVDSTAYFPFGVDLTATVQEGGTYQWFRNDTLVIDQGTTVFKATQTGDYKIRVLKDGCSVNSNEIRVTILIPLSVEPTTFINKVTAFPNPTSEKVTIKSTTLTPLRATCRIINMQGKQVYNNSKIDAATNQEWNINASHWAAGTYIYRITTTNGEASGKIIKR